jgi:signal transduction histidine kinase/ligand-binding sensor domain-containing protein/DNA-binding response OmpR family regulator
MGKKIVTITFLLVFPLYIFSQSVEFKNYNTEDGLSNLRVRSFLQDRFGFIWVGTANGLNKFDGYQFEAYRYENANPHSLKHSGVTALFEDSRHHFWIGTKGGLQLMDINDQSFYPANTSTHPLFGQIGAVFDLHEDQHGHIWVAAANGLFRITIAGSIQNAAQLKLATEQQQLAVEPVTVFVNGQQAPQSLRIWSIEEGAPGYLWIGTNTGLAAYSLAREQFVSFSSAGIEKANILFRAPVQSLLYDQRSQLWVGTEEGLFRCVSDLSSCKYYTTAPSQEHALRNTFITEIAEDRRGQLWIGSDGGGLARWVPEADHFIHYQNHILHGRSLNDDNIEALYIDHNDGMWVGTHKGISYYNSHQKPFYILQADGRPQSITKGGINDLYSSDQGELWIAIDEGGINLYTPSSQQFQHYQHIPGQYNSITDNDVASILLDQRGTLWVGSWGGGLSTFSPSSPPGTTLPLIRHYLYSSAEETALQTPYIWTIYESQQGDIWIGTVEDGLIKYDYEHRTFQFFDGQGTQEGELKGSWVTGIYEDAQQHLWVNTNKGLFQLLDKESRFMEHQLPCSDMNIHNHPACIYPLEGTRLLLGTASGLVLYDYRTRTCIQKWTEQDGLINNWIKAMQKDHSGRFWLATSMGISSFDLTTEVFTNYSSADGLLPGEFSSASAITPDGTLYFATDNGLVYFEPDSIKNYDVIPPVVITGFKTFDQSFSLAHAVASDSTLSTQLEPVQLSYKTNDFSIQFTTLDYISPSKNQYQYRLTGLQNNWIIADASHRIAQFTNISPGSYTFEVKGSNHDGIWNPVPARLTIIISPPWWRSWWSYLLYFVLAGCLLYGLYVTLNRRLILKTQLKRKQEEAEYLKELDHFKSRLYTNITHEFRTPLTVILGMVQQIRHTPETYMQEGLSLIESNSKSLLKLINQLLDLSKLENRSFKLQLQQGDIVAYLRYLTESFQTFASSQNLGLRFSSTVEKLIMDYDQEQVKQVLANLLSNAIKYTPSGGTIEVRLHRQGHQLIIEVSDTGIGIPPEDCAHIFDRFYQVDSSSTRKGEGTGIGLAHTRELVNMMEGSITVSSELGKGSTFTLCLPIRLGEHTEAASTTFDVDPVVSPIRLSLPEPAQQKQRGKEPQILIIEDNPDVVRYLKICLQEDYQLDIAYNGKIGLEKAIQAIPDLIISDVMMPEMNGFQVCDTLKNDRRTSHIPFILLTAKVDIDARIEGFRKGADAYLEKPFDKEELMARLQMMLMQQARMRQYFSSQDSQFPKLEADADEQLNAEAQFIQEIRQLIQHNYQDESFGLSVLCQEIGMSRSQLFRKMKALMGVSPSQYIRSYRLEKSRELLQSSALNVSEVSWKVGFKDPAYFSKAFHEAYGVPPSQYKSG